MKNLPSNLEECFLLLESTLSGKDLADLTKMEQKDLCKLHHGLGGWIRNNWGLWHNGPLKLFFMDIKIVHPDDMSGIIIESFWHYLRNEPLELDNQIKIYQDFLEKTGESMNREDLLKDMKNSIGTKDPIVFFEKMVDVFNLLFNKIDELENLAKRNALLTSLAIKWDPSIASSMLAIQVDILRQNKDVFHEEISILKKAYADNSVTSSYDDFCKFWINVLGWHPFFEK